MKNWYCSLPLKMLERRGEWKRGKSKNGNKPCVMQNRTKEKSIQDRVCIIIKRIEKKGRGKLPKYAVKTG
jgi:hypothetical protein